MNFPSKFSFGDFGCTFDNAAEFFLTKPGKLFKHSPNSFENVVLPKQIIQSESSSENVEASFDIKAAKFTPTLKFLNYARKYKKHKEPFLSDAELH